VHPGKESAWSIDDCPAGHELVDAAATDGAMPTDWRASADADGTLAGRFG